MLPTPRRTHPRRSIESTVPHALIKSHAAVNDSQITLLCSQRILHDLPVFANISGTDTNRAGLAVGSYTRQVLFSRPAPRAVRAPPVDRQALAQVLALLGRLASNVNQISRSLNLGNRPETGALGKSLKEITEMRNALMAALGREGTP